MHIPAASLRQAARLPDAEAAAILRAWANPPGSPRFDAAARQLGLWIDGKPWRIVMWWLCVGCGRRPVHVRRTYCKICKERLSKHLPTDLDEDLTKEDVKRVRRAVPADFMPERRRD